MTHTEDSAYIYTANNIKQQLTVVQIISLAFTATFSKLIIVYFLIKISC